jgi:PilZ domain-containing protein
MANAGDSSDRREDVRIDVSFPIIVELAPGGERSPAVVENVSLGGVLLRTDVSLPVNGHITLEIQPHEGPVLRLPATVVRFSGTQSYGTAFATLTEADADRLMAVTAQFLRAAAPAPWFIG